MPSQPKPQEEQTTVPIQSDNDQNTSSTDATITALCNQLSEALGTQFDSVTQTVEALQEKMTKEFLECQRLLRIDQNEKLQKAVDDKVATKVKKRDEQWGRAMVSFLDSLFTEMHSIALGTEYREASERHANMLLRYLEAVGFIRINPPIGEPWDSNNDIKTQCSETKTVGANDPLNVLDVQEWGYTCNGTNLKKAVVVVPKRNLNQESTQTDSWFT